MKKFQIQIFLLLATISFAPATFCKQYIGDFYAIAERERIKERAGDSYAIAEREGIKERAGDSYAIAEREGIKERAEAALQSNEEESKIKASDQETPLTPSRSALAASRSLFATADTPRLPSRRLSTARRTAFDQSSQSSYEEEEEEESKIKASGQGTPLTLPRLTPSSFVTRAISAFVSMTPWGRQAEKNYSIKTPLKDIKVDGKKLIRADGHPLLILKTLGSNNIMEIPVTENDTYQSIIDKVRVHIPGNTQFRIISTIRTNGIVAEAVIDTGNNVSPENADPKFLHFLAGLRGDWDPHTLVIY